MTNLEKYLHQLRRIEEHRSKGAEKEIRRLYKQVLKDLNSFLTDIYIHYSEDDMLTFGNLAKAGMDARFLEEVEQRINGISSNVSKAIHDTVEQTYEACYDGMRNAVVKAAGNRELLKTALSTVAAVTPDVIRAAVNNPISGLTLNDTLEKHRKEIIYDIKRNIGVGLSNGDRFTTMAKRISQSVDADYNKAIRIVRTEAHRVREAGFHDSATAINDTLKQGESGYVMAKTWKTMADERVRPNTVYKTKKGWKKGKKSKYNHEKMDGVTILVDEEFKLPSGAKAKAPGQTGKAGEDINCRCYLSYDLVEVGVLNSGKGNVIDLSDLENTQDYRPVNRSEDSSKMIRGNQEIMIRKIENSTYSGDIYISDSVKLKPKEMHNIETSINEALKIVGSSNNVPRCIIISPSEMQTGAVCSYKASINTLYINSVISDTEKLLSLQEGMACQNNPLSTYLHEFIHWKDAEDYRKTREISSQMEYLNDLRKKCKKKLDKLEKQGYNIFDISQYAKDEYMKKKYDETWTEYRVVQFLERKR